ncbi:hypothetical protein GCM10007036_43700 [Alsobacter metallidurans]|uniref:Uncharacterized protein n=2 Tax=Alsobacter metallidurans TaxID=340221 RepID=A0A917MJL9_9HYPH|nr:hypothetical protein GCM10007036_43700 [Alsobacter metallidurans]
MLTLLHPAVAEAPEPPFASLDPSWAADWAASLASPSMRAMISRDPRLRERLPSMLAVAHQAGRLEAAAVSVADLGAYRAFVADPARFRHLLGLAWHARALSRVIDGDLLRAHGGQIDATDLPIVMSFADIETECEALPQPGRLLQAAETVALRLIQAWAAGLPAAYRARVAFCVPKNINLNFDQLEFENHYLALIVHRVAEALRRP